MKRFGILLPSVIALLLISTSALAAGDAAGAEHHGHNWEALGLQVFNIALIGFILFRFVREPLSDFLKQRSSGIREQIEASERSLAEAEQEIAALRQQLGSFEAEKVRFIQETQDNARSEATRNIESANETSIRIQEDAVRVANQEIARARKELQIEAASLATKLAGDILRENLTPDDDQRIVADFVERVGSQS
ncbi:MAG: ATP synthase F0 subunit B [bacterium]|nr:ATP synthase F0 subunit B [bacterium]